MVKQHISLTTEMERRRVVSVQEAAEFAGVSKDTFKRHYSHLIRVLSPRRRGVQVGDLLDISGNPGAAR
jgi:hypothetical protein